MEIELKDFLEGTTKGISEVPAESELLEIIKGIIKFQFKEETKSGYIESCKLIKMILGNIVKNPEESKYRTIKLNNAKFSQLVARFVSGMMMLEMMGFEVVHDDEPFVIYAHKELEILIEVGKVMEKVIEGEGKEKEKKAEIKVQPVISRVKKVGSKEKDVADQLAEYRKMQKTKVPSKKHLVGQEARLVTESPQVTQGYIPPDVPNAYINPLFDYRNISIRVFELTNFFRVNQGKLAIVWNEGLSQIATEHSKNMAEGIVPFGHDGYKKRYKRFPIKGVKGGAENVAFNSGFTDPGKVCVDGWMESGRHRSNLLGNFNIMGVGVWANSQGCIFFTQLLALNS